MQLNEGRGSRVQTRDTTKYSGVKRRPRRDRRFGRLNFPLWTPRGKHKHWVVPRASSGSATVVALPSPPESSVSTKLSRTPFIPALPCELCKLLGTVLLNDSRRLLHQRSESIHGRRVLRVLRTGTPTLAYSRGCVRLCGNPTTTQGHKAFVR